MEKKYIKVFVIVIVISLIFLVGTLGIVSALTSYEKDTASKITDILAKFRYLNEKGFYIFTSWGQENGCSVYPDWSGWIKGSATWSSLPSSVSCSKVSGVFSGSNKCAIDIWYDNTIYPSNSGGPPSNVNYNNWLKEVAGTGVSFSSTARPYYFVEVYACPSTPPTIEEHSTKAYTCENGNWVSKGYYDKDESCSWDTSGTNRCWCSDEDDNFYVDKSGGVHCQPSTYSSVTNRVWCSTLTTNPTCSDGIQNQGETGVDCGGPCSACGAGGGTGTTGDIRLNGEVSVGAPSLTGGPTTIKVPLKNFGTKTETINLEAGFYSPGYATGVADLYSTFPLFSSVPTPNCNPAEEFVKTKQITLSSGETEKVEISVNPYSVFVTYDVGTHDLRTEGPVWFAGLYKECLGGYINEAGTTGKGIMYDYGEYSMQCPLSWFSSDILCGGEKSGICKVNTFEITKKCSITSTVDVVNGTTPLASIGDTSLADWKKLSLTREQISTATNDELFASSCLMSSECLATTKSENYSISCVNIASLRNDGTLTPVQSDSFFDHSNEILNGALTGAGIGLGVGVLACVGGNILAAIPLTFAVGIPLAVIGCPALLSGATTIGGAVVGAALGNAIHPSDELVKKLQAKDANSVGICTATPKGGGGLDKYFKWAAWFDVDGNGIKDGTDGLIIVVVLGALLFIILRK